MSELLTLLCTAEDCGKRIDKYISDNAEMLTRSAVQGLIGKNAVTADGKAVSKNYKIRGTETIEVEIPDAEPMDAVPENIPLDIVYEDEDLLVVNKPKGMVVHPAHGNYHGTLVNALLYHCGDSLSGINGVIRPGIVHRIDKNTSGLLIVAKNDKAHLHLAEQIKAHVSRPGKFAHGPRHNSDRTRAGNQYVLANRVKGKGGMYRISKGVENRVHFFGDTGLAAAYVFLGDNEIFRKSAVAVNTNANGILAKMAAALKAVSAFSANNVSLTGNDISNLPVDNVFADLCNLSHVFVTDNHRSFNCFLRPLVPVVNVQISTADSGLMYFDFYFVRANLGLGHVHEPKTLFGQFFNKSFHNIILR